MHAKKRAEEEVIEALSDDKTIRLQTPTVISTVGSGVGKSTCSTLRSIGAGDFGAQSFNRVYILLTPYRHAAPLEMTVTASRSPVISTAAKRSGEISLLYAAWLWCIPRLPACRYVAALGSLTSRTEILHSVQNDGPGRKAPHRLSSVRLNV